MPAQNSVPLYETFDAYDRFVNWERRLAYELPFIERQLAADTRPDIPQSAGHPALDAGAPSGPLRVLDVACGTGKHAIALAQRGYDVTGVDLSAAMIERARANAAKEGVDGVRFAVAGFGALAEQTAGGYDALLCVGNSLPHVLSNEDLHGTLVDMAAVLRPGGVLFFQMRNMDAVLEQQARWMPLQARQEESPTQEGGHEWLFIRFYDFNPDGSLTFNVVTCEREGRGPWRERRDATRLYPWRQAQLVDALAGAGFDDVRCYGNMAGAPYDRQSSGDLVLKARR